MAASSQVPSRWLFFDVRRLFALLDLDLFRLAPSLDSSKLSGGLGPGEDGAISKLRKREDEGIGIR